MDQTHLEALTAPGRWWSLRQARDHLAPDTPKSRRTLERWLKKALAWPEAPDLIVSEQATQDRATLLRRHAIAEARRKRQHVLLVQLARLADGRACLHAQDGRGARFWYPFAEAEPSREQLRATLAALDALHPRGIVTLPYGVLASRLADTPDRLSGGSMITTSTSLPAASEPSSLQWPDLGGGRSARPLDPVLRELEAESLHMLREAVGGSKNPILLFSAGKDSAVLLHLVRKAFFPMRPPLPILHIDTRWKFQAMYTYRDQAAKAVGMELRVYINPQAITDNINPFDDGPTRHTDITKTQAVRQALDAAAYDTIIAGARRDEEKSRAKERRFSIRTAGHRWDPRRQRPEPWNLYHTGLGAGESLRVFPLSNWTELDVWRYIERENIPLVELYFAAQRPVVRRDGQLIVIDDGRFRLTPRDVVEYRTVRFRSLGCYPLTAAIESPATTVAQIIEELETTNQSERMGRVIDKDQPGSMERKKREGYF